MVKPVETPRGRLRFAPVRWSSLSRPRDSTFERTLSVVELVETPRVDLWTSGSARKPLASARRHVLVQLKTSRPKGRSPTVKPSVLVRSFAVQWDQHLPEIHALRWPQPELSLVLEDLPALVM